MRTQLTSLLTVVGAVTVLALAGNTVALATTGKALIAGHTNTSKKLTTVKRTTTGSALQLRTTSSAAAPLIVNGKGRVTNLNADKLDGLDSRALRANTYLWTKNVTSPTTYIDLLVPLPTGSYVIGYDAALPGAGVDGEQVGCSFARTRGGLTDRYYAESRIVSKSGYRASLSGTGIITVKAGDKVEFFCGALGSFTTAEERPIQIYATRTNVLTGAALRDAVS